MSEREIRDRHRGGPLDEDVVEMDARRHRRGEAHATVLARATWQEAAQQTSHPGEDGTP